MAQRLGKEEMGKKAVVHANVHIGEPNHFQGFGLAVDIKVEGVDEELLKAGHEVCWYKILDEILVASCFTNNSSQFCPYSRALTHGALVKVSTSTTTT